MRLIISLAVYKCLIPNLDELHCKPAQKRKTAAHFKNDDGNLLGLIDFQEVEKKMNKNPLAILGGEIIILVK